MGDSTPRPLRARTHTDERSTGMKIHATAPVPARAYMACVAYLCLAGGA